MSRWWWIGVAAAMLLPPPVAAQPGPASPAPAAADDEDDDDGPRTDRGGMAGERTLVDTLDEDRPLELGDQLRIFRQARRRRSEVERMEGMLTRRARRLQKVQQEIENRYKTLRMLQEEIVAVTEEGGGATAEQAARQNTQDEARKVDQVRKLGKVVDKMKAPDAAKMLEVMNEPLVVDVMLIIKPKQAAKILGQMEPKLAARIGEEMTRLKEQRRRRR